MGIHTTPFWEFLVFLALRMSIRKETGMVSLMEGTLCVCVWINKDIRDIMLINFILHNGERDYDIGILFASVPSTGGLWCNIYITLRSAEQN